MADRSPEGGPNYRELACFILSALKDKIMAKYFNYIGVPTRYIFTSSIVVIAINFKFSVSGGACGPYAHVPPPPPPPPPLDGGGWLTMYTLIHCRLDWTTDYMAITTFRPTLNMLPRKALGGLGIGSYLCGCLTRGSPHLHDNKHMA